MITSPIIAHRGLSSLAPENTLAALKLAAEQGVQWVEIDAIACGDGSIVMWHDNSVDRCSDGTGAMNEHSAQSVAKLDCGSWFSNAFKGEPVASIEQAIILIQSLGLGLNLEIKLYENSAEQVTAPVLKLLAEHWQDFDKLIISSFDHAALTYCHQNAPQIQLGVLYDKIPDHWESDLQSVDAVSCHCNYKHLTQAQTSAIKAKNYQLYCYTANDPKSVEDHWEWGVDAIITDYPQRYLSERQRGEIQT